MKNLILKNGNYCLYQVGSSYLRKIAEFIVTQNYKHHLDLKNVIVQTDEIDNVYREEVELADNSLIYIVEDLLGKMIGCIRVAKWDKTKQLPVHKIFNINPLDFINSLDYSTFWHVGRFAVDSCIGAKNISLFKLLMIYAIYPVFNSLNGYLIAECDSKLLRVMKLLGIDMKALSGGIHYLGSETIPVFTDKNGLMRFYNTYIHMYHVKRTFLKQNNFLVNTPR